MSLDEFRRFLGSFTAGSWIRLLMTIALTTGSVMTAYGEQATVRLIIGCNLVTISGAFYMEYRSFMVRSQTPPPKKKSKKKR